MKNIESLIKPVRARLAFILVLGALTGGVMTVWKVHQSHQNAATDALYRKAFWGDAISLKRLTAMQSEHTNKLLTDLLLNDQSLADRTSVADALDRRHALPDVQLAAMLDVTKSRALRHAAFVVFQKRGCNEECVEGALRVLNQIWSGVPTIEESKLKGFAIHPSVLNETRNATEEEAVALLDSNPCQASQQSTRYGSVFASKIRSTVHNSGECK